MMMSVCCDVGGSRIKISINTDILKISEISVDIFTKISVIKIYHILII